MSAFIVSHDHIDALLTFARIHRVSYYVPQSICNKPGGTRVDINIQTVTEVGRILLTENERSIYARYPDCRPGGNGNPGTIGEDAANYKYRDFSELHRLQKGVQCVWIMNGCRCFDYQACETDDYEESLARSIIEAIRDAAIRALPGTSDAPWEINRKASVC